MTRRFGQCDDQTLSQLPIVVDVEWVGNDPLDLLWVVQGYEWEGPLTFDVYDSPNPGATLLASFPLVSTVSPGQTLLELYGDSSPVPVGTAWYVVRNVDGLHLQRGQVFVSESPAQP